VDDIVLSSFYLIDAVQCVALQCERSKAGAFHDVRMPCSISPCLHVRTRLIMLVPRITVY
jgi:hypothetical protein